MSSPPDDTLVPGGKISRIKANVAAIELAKSLEKEKRNPTPEEKKILAQFTGWGALGKEAFEPETVDPAATRIRTEPSKAGMPANYSPKRTRRNTRPGSSGSARSSIRSSAASSPRRNGTKPNPPS